MDPSTYQDIATLASLIDSGASEESILEKIESLGNDVLVDALQNPFQTVMMLSGQTCEVDQFAGDGNGFGGQDEIMQLSQLCGGDVEYARDIYFSVNQDLVQAMEILTQPGSQNRGNTCSGVSSTSSSSRSESKEEIELRKLTELCGGNREFAESIYESAQRNFVVAKSLLD